MSLFVVVATVKCVHNIDNATNTTKTKEQGDIILY